MRWALHVTRSASLAMRQKIDRLFMADIWEVLDKLVEDPNQASLQPTEVDPSVFWLALPGDHVALLEIVDEKLVVRLLEIR